ncbi:2-oxoacid:ferredoxin oxidoreductase subunit beta [Candidatus Microgenomates bacterium]|nr:MAG: 2-oxoacid:ferredoxin oxidoreductase subunit beta [Candidatus Microgenomates bacterium]
MTELKDLEVTYDKPNWCPGCGDFGIWIALKNAITSLNLNPWEVVLVSGIGCGAKLPYWVKTYGINTLHGRAIPVAEGIKLANKNLTVIVIAGDGDQYGEGLNHFIHASRRNIDITVLVHNNQLYSLTTGQYSPTTDIGSKNKASSVPTVEVPVNPISLALCSGATFVARGFSGDAKFQSELLAEGIKHKGFSIIDTMQPCVTFNHKNTFAWFYERIHKLENHDSSNLNMALEKAQKWPLRKALREGEKEEIPIGVFYKEEKQTFEETFPQISETSLVKQSIENIDINPLLEELG